MRLIIFLSIVSAILFILDVYYFRASKAWFNRHSTSTILWFNRFFWGLSAITLLIILLPLFVELDRKMGAYLVAAVFTNLLCKILGTLVFLFDDIRRGLTRLVRRLSPPQQAAEGQGISRSEFLTKTGLFVSSIPAITMSYGIISGAHDYTVFRETLHLKKLPKAFDGIQIAQISDIHTGSFYNKVAVQGGVDMLLGEKPDMIFFTGDLVNAYSKEMEDYIPIFSQLRAPLGVYSVLGNHDYSDYGDFSSESDRSSNSSKIRDGHLQMGWDLLTNEHRIVEVDGEKLAVLGSENWGAGRFSKYGDLAKTYGGLEKEIPKLLLSHDPTHWDAQVKKMYPDIDLQLAGHTHGAQFGVEWGDFRWSPAQYIYDQWAGLYKDGEQFLYVNRGYGYIGIPSRMGIPPEITIITLKSA